MFFPLKRYDKQWRHPYHLKIRKSMKDKNGSSQALLPFSADVSAKMIRDALSIKNE